jgi:protein-S-isoprenylcysteine O-methyltransferase Ste14
MEMVFRFLAFAAVAFMILQVCYMGYRGRVRSFGRPAIALPWFCLAKICALWSLLCLLGAAWRGRQGLTLPAALAALLLLVLGTAAAALGFSTLGKNLRAGLADEGTELITGGIFRITRNPVYLGIALILVSSEIYAFSWHNLTAMIVTAILHHRIVLAEEAHLIRRFPAYRGYCRSVRRYI